MPSFYGTHTAVLDVGSSKVCCLVARQSGGNVKITGVGHQSLLSKHSRWNGPEAVPDLNTVEDSIRQTVTAAERTSNARITTISTSVPFRTPLSNRAQIDIPLNGKQVTLGSLARSPLKIDHEPETTSLVHAIPLSYSIDGLDGIRDPIGMRGDQLHIDLHLVQVEQLFTANLISCLDATDIAARSMTFPAYAAGHAVLNEEERKLGSVVVDIGAMRTSYGIFHDGALVYAGGFLIAGEHITQDLARSLGVRMADAERVKTLHASVDRQDGHNDQIELPALGESGHGEHRTVSRRDVDHIVSARVEEILGAVREGIEQSGFRDVLSRNAVLTGGTSQLTGMAQKAAKVLSRHTRIGYPRPISGMTDMLKTPEFAVSIGLILLDEHPTLDFAHERSRAGRNRFRALLHWLKENF